jgi:hypothetical protein
MSEPMTVRVEVWPVVADEVGLWLVSGGDAWRSDAVMADSEPHAEVELLLWENGASGKVELIHSTSWRADGPSTVLTYMVIFNNEGLARDDWPAALPIGLDLATVVGRPPTHAAVDAPAPRYIDVLLHGVRHLRFLLDHDATNAAAMNELWRRHLSVLQPALSTMYDQKHGQS